MKLLPINGTIRDEKKYSAQAGINYLIVINSNGAPGVRLEGVWLHFEHIFVEDCKAH